MDTPLYARLDVILTVDAGANLALAAAMAVYGLEQWLEVRTDPVRPGPVIAFAALDGLVGAGLVGLAVVDPTAAQTWLRWVLGALGGIVLLVGAVKANVLRHARSADPVSGGRAVSA